MRSSGAAVVQDPADVPDRSGSNRGEDAVDDHLVIAKERGERVSTGVECPCADKGEASHIGGACLQARAPAWLEDRIAMGAVRLEGILVGIDDGQAGGAGEAIGQNGERIIGEHVASVENPDAVIGSVPAGDLRPIGPRPLEGYPLVAGDNGTAGKIGRPDIRRDYIERPLRISLRLQ